MKQGLVFMILLVCFQYAARATRPLNHKNLQEDVKVSSLSQMGQSGAGEDDARTADWLEGCENEEECLKRRMISEAHLDYIYTQQHMP